MSNTGVPGGVWFYIPNLGAAIFFAILFTLWGCVITYHAFCGGIRRFFCVVIIGVLMEVGGFACRAAAHQNLDQIAPFATQQSLIVLAPLFVAAGNYMVISRIIGAINGDGSLKQRILLIPSRRITPIFVTSDVVTILIQVAGTTISAGANWKGSTAALGSHILLAGLAIQTATVAFFVSISLKFGGRQLFSLGQGSQGHHFKGLKSIFISSVFIELRCIYRLIEWAMGYNGYPFTHEWDFYVFEALPMIVAIGTYTWWYPPHYVPQPPEKEPAIEIQSGGHRRHPSLEDGMAR